MNKASLRAGFFFAERIASAAILHWLALQNKIGIEVSCLH
jgi:hypothetical protein